LTLRARHAVVASTWKGNGRTPVGVALSNRFREPRSSGSPQQTCGPGYFLGGVSALGSLLTGWLGSKYPQHIILGLLYMLRSVVIVIYFVMPPTPTSMLLFAAAMGVLWWPGLAPLIGGLVANIFGTHYMATLLGLSFVVHQMGSSLGAWGGGIIFDFSGSYDAAWQIGALIGFVAGIVQILAGGPTRRPDRPTVPAVATA
jgi:predicted MFS family arabinose efflux permease